MVLKNDWDTGDSFTAADANDIADEVNTATAALDGKVPTSRTVSPGTGLTGGGDLTANRTLSADFGSAAGKVCQGNDSRLSDARTPTAHTHGTSGIDDGAITSVKIADGAIVNADVNASAAIALSKLAAGYAQGSANGTPTTVTVWWGTQSQYDAIGSPSSSTLYFIV